jgi:hypothetical protein
VEKELNPSFHELLQAKQANYKDWKYVLSEQFGHNVTWVEKKNSSYKSQWTT